MRSPRSTSTLSSAGCRAGAPNSDSSSQARIEGPPQAIDCLAAGEGVTRVARAATGGAVALVTGAPFGADAHAVLSASDSTPNATVPRVCRVT